MSPPRAPYRPPRNRREVVFAVLGVVAVLVFTGVMLWVLAPESDEPAPVPPAATTIPPSDAATSTTAPGTTTPGSSGTSAPTQSTASSSAPSG